MKEWVSWSFLVEWFLASTCSGWVWNPRSGTFLPPCFECHNELYLLKVSERISFFPISCTNTDAVFDSLLMDFKMDDLL